MKNLFRITFLLFFTQTFSQVGINTTSPSAEFEVNGFTKLGSPSPAIKLIKLTGTTNIAQGGSVSINHGLVSSKILAITIFVDTTGFSIPPSYSANSGYEYDYFITSTSIIILNKNGSSSAILSKPIRILITYEE